MENSVVLAIATFVLAAVAVWSILQTRSIQKSERRQRQLNEICDWAVSLYRYQYGKDYKAFLEAETPAEQRRAIFRHILEFKEKLQTTEGQRKYIRVISTQFKGGISEAIQESLNDLEAYIEFLNKWQHRIVKGPIFDTEDDGKIGDDHWNKIERSLTKVIAEAANLKIVD